MANACNRLLTALPSSKVLDFTIPVPHGPSCHVAEVSTRMTYLVGYNVKWPWPILGAFRTFSINDNGNPQKLLCRYCDLELLYKFGMSPIHSTNTNYCTTVGQMAQCVIGLHKVDFKHI